jgi:HPt (histidine-containing phosphotransfer) domain-containing protein
MTEHVTDLTFLKNFARGDQKILEKFIRIFLSDGASVLNLLQRRINDADWPGIETAAHTLRSQFNFMGIKEGEPFLIAIKTNAASQKDLAAAKMNLERINDLFASASRELEDELNFLKNSGIRF